MSDIFSFIYETVEEGKGAAGEGSRWWREGGFGKSGENLEDYYAAFYEE